MNCDTVKSSISLECLDALEIVNAVNGHGVNHLVSTLHFSHRLGALLTLLLGLLGDDNLAVFKDNLGSHLSTIRSRLGEILAQLEGESHGLQSGGGGDCPRAVRLSDLHGGGGDCRGLAEKEIHLQGLEELLVLDCLGPGELPLERV